MNDSFKDSGIGTKGWITIVIVISVGVGAVMYLMNLSSQQPPPAVGLTPWHHTQTKIVSLGSPVAGDRLPLFAVPGCVLRFNAKVTDIDPLGGRIVADIVPVIEPGEGGGTAGSWFYLEVWGINSPVDQVTWEITSTSAQCPPGIFYP